MATEDTSAKADAQAAPTPETTTATPEAANEPTRHSHSQTVLATCDELGISRDDAALMDSAALRQEISDARTLADVRRAKQRPVAQAAQPAAAETEEDEDFVIPAEVEAELENTPHTKALIKALGKDAIRGRKAREEVKQVRQQANNQSLEARGNAVLAQIPLPPGVDRQTRDMVVWQTAAALDRAGQFQGMTLEQAMAEAAKRCYPMVGAKAPAEAAAAAAATKPKPKPAPTTTVRPTNRLAAALQGQVDHMDGNTPDDFVP